MDDEDCGETSGGEDGQERLAASKPTKRKAGPEEEWDECAVTIDAREAAGISNRRARLSTALDEA